MEIIYLKEVTEKKNPNNVWERAKVQIIVCILCEEGSARVTVLKVKYVIIRLQVLISEMVNWS